MAVLARKTITKKVDMLDEVEVNGWKVRFKWEFIEGQIPQSITIEGVKDGEQKFLTGKHLVQENSYSINYGGTPPIASLTTDIFDTVLAIKAEHEPVVEEPEVEE